MTAPEFQPGDWATWDAIPAETATVLSVSASGKGVRLRYFDDDVTQLPEGHHLRAEVCRHVTPTAEHADGNHWARITDQDSAENGLRRTRGRLIAAKNGDLMVEPEPGQWFQPDDGCLVLVAPPVDSAWTPEIGRPAVVTVAESKTGAASHVAPGDVVDVIDRSGQEHRVETRAGDKVWVYTRHLRPVAPEPAEQAAPVHFVPWGSEVAPCGWRCPCGDRNALPLTDRRKRTTCGACQERMTNWSPGERPDPVWPEPAEQDQPERSSQETIDAAHQAGFDALITLSLTGTRAAAEAAGLRAEVERLTEQRNEACRRLNGRSAEAAEARAALAAAPGAGHDLPDEPPAFDLKAWGAEALYQVLTGRPTPHFRAMLAEREREAAQAQAPAGDDEGDEDAARAMFPILYPGYRWDECTEGARIHLARRLAAAARRAGTPTTEDGDRG